MRKDRLEFAWLSVFVVLIIAPTAALCAFGAMVLKRAEGAYERDVREAYSKAALALVSQCVSDVRTYMAEIEAEAPLFALERTVDARADMARRCPMLDSVAILDSQLRVVYPRDEASVQARGAENPPLGLLEAQHAEATQGPATAIAFYDTVLQGGAINDDTRREALSGVARCLASTGRAKDAVAAYEALAVLPAGPGELSLPLLGRFRAWELAPSRERLTALVQACLEAALKAPAGQIRYYLQRTAGEDISLLGDIVSRTKLALALRQKDALAAKLAPLVVADRPSFEQPGWRWRSVSAGNSWIVVGAARTGRADDSGFAVAAIDAGVLADAVVRPALAEAASDAGAQYRLSTKSVYGRFAEDPAKAGLVTLRAFPSPFEFWTVEVYSTSGQIGDLARSRAALVYWGVILSGAALFVGLTGALFLVRRRMRLARLQTDFVANVTHELKTPLTGIKGLAETLVLDRVSEPERRTEFLEAIVRETERLSRLINNALDFSRLERGAQRLTLERTDLVELTRDAVRAFENGLNGEGELKIAVSAQGEPVYVFADPDVMRRAVFNLLDNAYKYSSPPRKVSVSVEARGGLAIVRVTDNGIGLTRGQMRKVFRKFYRAETGLSARTQGAGLGLTLVKSYIRAHGGRVEVESRIGQGSTFSILLPFADEEVR